MMAIAIIEGGRGQLALERVDRAVREALHVHFAGERPAPLFVVPPGTDEAATREEVLALGIPEGAGVLMRTSGSTTGTGKIVALSWDSLVASVRATHDALGGPGVWAAHLPFHHIAGFQTVVRSALHSLASENSALCAVDLDLSDALAIRSALNNHERVYLSLVPTQLLRILDDPQVLDALRQAVFLVGGAGIHAQTLERARAAGLRIHTSYGMTETCGGCVYDGEPIGDTDILLSDEGRISLRGSCIALGYLGQETGEDFTISPDADSQGQPRTHHTKDAGSFTDGKLDILGRIDDAITTGGLTVMPSLIEAALAKTGWDAVVVGIPHLEWGEAVVAVVDDRAAHAQSCNITVMRSFVKLALGEGWAPTYVVGLSELSGTLPLTDSGKVNRRELSDMVAAHLSL
ncbi:O-succinylbenzoic acid--CoA ligase [Trueperella bonasi]|uniref:O-succinylbenzoic acid--CoA ligase n=1 Tax=Trueperella bonasi TaxID=312286 RepID=A0ABT9NGY7_9ACTO|nr:AMP-binding protein [Trueperella bonasi]MDP9806674.1 O-succinylbenzoic acid--CoA ligase [Trueperella bonasi]